MYKLLICFFLLASSAPAMSQNQDRQAVLKVLEQQNAEWNKGNIESFMKGYWNNDSLMFIGSQGITYGYNNTLNNYKKTYSDASKMGQLFFDILQVKRLDTHHFFVVGKWFLKRTAGDVGGQFTLIFKKINGQWLIIADHSS